MIKTLKILLKRIETGFYDGWAIGYIQDVNAPNEVKEKDMILDELFNPIKDFLHSRIIELEDKK